MFQPKVQVSAALQHWEGLAREAGKELKRQHGATGDTKEKIGFPHLELSLTGGETRGLNGDTLRFSKDGVYAGANGAKTGERCGAPEICERRMSFNGIMNAILIDLEFGNPLTREE